MKRMKRKEVFIDVIGTWTGGIDDEVTRWLALNPAWVWQIQSEDDEQIGWRTKPRHGVEVGEEDLKPRRQMVILGQRLYDEVNLGIGSTLVIAEDGRLAAYDPDLIEDQFEDA